MTDLFFVDTNLLVYQRDNRNPEKNQAADAWIAALWATRRGRISYQVLSEFYAVLRRPQLAACMQSAMSCLKGRALTVKDPTGRNVDDRGVVDSRLVSARRDRLPRSPLNVPPCPAADFLPSECRAYTRDDRTPG
jgi:predicted nucleic acid-binding protein